MKPLGFVPALLALAVGLAAAAPPRGAPSDSVGQPPGAVVGPAPGGARPPGGGPGYGHAPGGGPGYGYRPGGGIYYGGPYSYWWGGWGWPGYYPPYYWPYYGYYGYYGSGYYGPGYGYLPSTVFYGPPGVVTSTNGVTYIERQTGTVSTQQAAPETVPPPPDAAPPASASTITPAAGGPWWYFCSSPRGAYPYVRECPGGWERVPAVPPGPSR